jgi:hypothetical protein
VVAQKKTAAPKRSTAKRAPARNTKTAAAGAKTTKKSTTRKPPLQANGLMLVAVFGPFGRRALVEMSAERALGLFDQPLSPALAPTRVIDATLNGLAELAKRAPGIDESSIAATAVALAYEIDSPFNSATSKSLCAKQLRETMALLNDAAPEKATDRLDELGAKRSARQQKLAAAR